MEYNKNQFNKISDKKVLHKKGKQWITLSLGLLMAIGGTTAVTHADTNANANTNTTTPNNPQQQSNNNQAPKYNLQSATPQQAQSTQSNTSNGRKLASSTPSLKAIGKQATALHRNIILNNMQNSQTNGQQNKTNQGSNNPNPANADQGNNHATSYSAVNTNANHSNNIPNNAPIYQTAKPNAAYANYLKEMGGQSAYDQMLSDEAKQQRNSNNKSIKGNKKPLLGTSEGQTKPDSDHWIYSNGKYLSDNNIHDWKNSTSDYYGLSYRYSPSVGALEFVKGILTWNSANDTTADPINFLKESDWDTRSDDQPLFFNVDASNIKSLKFDNKVNTNKVTDASYMFYSDPYLTSLSLSQGFGQYINDAGSMFSNDSILTSLNLSQGFGKNITNASSMFTNDGNLTSLSLPQGFGQQITDASNMFDRDGNLTDLSLPQDFGKNITNANDMFGSDHDQTSLSLPQGFGKNITNASGMFSSDGNLTSLSLPQGFGKNITNANGMFSGDSRLTSLSLPQGFGQYISDAGSMFSGDSKLTSLSFPQGFGKQITDASNMFESDKKLTSLNLPNSFGQKITNLNEVSDIIGVHPGPYDEDDTSINTTYNMYKNLNINFPNGVKNKSLINLLQKIGFYQVNLNNNQIDSNINPNGSIKLSYVLTASGNLYGLNYFSYFIPKTCKTFVLFLNGTLNKSDISGSDMSDVSPFSISSDYSDEGDKGFPFNHEYEISDIAKNGTEEIIFSKNTNTNNLTTAVGGYMNTRGMFGINSLVKVVLPNNFGQNITYAANMFSGSHITNLKLPFGKNLRDITDMFGDSDLTNLTLPNGFGQNITTFEDNPDSPFENIFSHNFYKLENEGNGIITTDSGHPLNTNTIVSDVKNEINLGGTYVSYYEGTYDGLNYKIHSNNNSVEFTGGTLTWNGTSDTPFLADAPSDLQNATQITFDKNANVSNTTNLSNMFFGMPKLQTINFNNVFSKVPVSDMTDMFGNDQNLSGIDLSGFDTTHVHSMANLFLNDQHLNSITFGNNFDTSNVKDMAGMFMNDKALPGIDLSHFDTGNVNSMLDMFAGDSSPKFTNLDFSKLPNFTTSKVVDMAGMFSNMSSLKSLNVSKFDTRKVNDMSSMFADIPVSGIDGLNKFNTKNVKDMNSMFFGMSNLTNLDLNNFNTGKVSDMRAMFGDDPVLKTITLGNNFTTDKSYNKHFTAVNNDGSKSDCSGQKYMFESDKALSSFNPSNVKLAKDAMFNHQGNVSTTLPGLRNSLGISLMANVQNHKPLLGAYNDSTNDHDELIYYTGSPSTHSDIVGNQMFYGAKGNADSTAMQQISFNVLPGLDLSRYYVANPAQITQLQNEQLTYSDSPHYIQVAPVEQGADLIEYVMSDNPNDIVGYHTEQGPTNTSDSDIYNDLKTISNGSVVGLNGYGVTPNGEKDAKQAATSKYDYKYYYNFNNGKLNGIYNSSDVTYDKSGKPEIISGRKPDDQKLNSNIIKIRVNKYSSDVIKYIDQSDNTPITNDSYNFSGVNPWSDTSVRQALSDIRNNASGYNFPSDYYVTGQGNQDISNALKVTHHYNDPNIDIHVAKKHPDTINVINSSDGSVLDTFSYMGIPNHQDSNVHSELSSIQSNVDSAINVSDGIHHSGWVLTPQGKTTVQQALAGQYSYHDSIVNVDVEAKQPDHLIYQDVSDNKTQYPENYYGQKNTLDSDIHNDLSDASKGTIDYDLGDDFYLTNSDAQKAGGYLGHKYTFNNSDAIVPMHRYQHNYIQFEDENDNSDVGTNSYRGPNEANDESIHQALSDISKDNDDGFDFDHNYYRLSSDYSVNDAKNDLKTKYRYHDSDAPAIVHVVPIQHASDKIEFDYNGKSIGYLSGYGKTGTLDDISSDGNVENIGASGETYVNSDTHDIHPGIDTSTYYISSDAINAFNSYKEQNPNSFRHNGSFYKINLSKYPSGINAVDFVTSDNQVIKQLTLSDIARRAFTWSDFIRQYPDMDPSNKTLSATRDSVPSNNQGLNWFDPTHTGKYQLSPEGQYEYAVLRHNDLGNLDFDGNVLKINIQPIDKASFTVIYTVNGHPYITEVSHGLKGYRVDGEDYLSADSYRDVSRRIKEGNKPSDFVTDQVFLNNSLLQPATSAGSDLEVDPTYRGLNGKKYLYNNQTITIPLVSKLMTDSFRYVTKSDKPVYTSTIVGNNQEITTDPTRNRDNKAMPVGAPNLSDTYSDNNKKGIPDALKNYKYDSDFQGIPSVILDGHTSLIPVVNVPDPNKNIKTYSVRYIDESDNKLSPSAQTKLFNDDFNTLVTLSKGSNQLLIKGPNDGNNATLLSNLNNLGGMTKGYTVDPLHVVNHVNWNSNTIFINIIPNKIKDNVEFNGDHKADYNIIGKQGTSDQVIPPAGYHFVTTTPSDTTDAKVQNDKGHFTFDGGNHIFTVAKDQVNHHQQSASATETVYYNWIYRTSNGNTTTSTSSSDVTATYVRSDDSDATTHSSIVGNWSQTNLGSFSAASAPSSAGWHIAKPNSYSGDVSQVDMNALTSIGNQNLNSLSNVIRSAATENVYMSQDSDVISFGHSSASVIVNYLNNSGYNPSVAPASSYNIGYSRNVYKISGTNTTVSYGDWSTSSSVSLPSSANVEYMHPVSSSITNTLPKPGSSVADLSGDEYVENVYYSDNMNDTPDSANVNDTVQYYYSNGNSVTSSASSDAIKYSRADNYDMNPNVNKNHQHSYGSWTTNQSFNPISYSAHVAINGLPYHIINSNVVLPTNDAINTSLDNHFDENKRSASASFNNDVHYAVDSNITSSPQSADATNHVHFLVSSNGQSTSVSSASLDSMEYHRSEYTDYDNNGSVSYTKWSTASTPFNSYGYPTSIFYDGQHYHAISQNVQWPSVSSDDLTNNSASYNTNIYYAPDHINSSSENASATDTVQYLLSGSNESLSASSVANAEYSRSQYVDTDNNNSTNYNSWSTTASLLSGYPASLMISGVRYHYVNTSTNVQWPNVPSDSLAPNKTASYNTNYNYAPDHINSNAESAPATDTVHYLLSGSNNDVLRPATSNSVEYYRSEYIDTDNGGSSSYNSWTTSASLSADYPANLNLNGKHYHAVNTNVKSDVLSDGLTNYNTDVYYVPDQINSSAQSAATFNTVNYLLSGSTEVLSSATSTSVEHYRSQYIDTDNNNSASYNPWSAATSVSNSNPASLMAHGHRYHLVNSNVQSSVMSDGLTNYNTNVYYAPDSVAVRVYYKNASNGDNLLSNDSYRNVIVGEGSSVTLSDMILSNYPNLFSGYHYIRALHYKPSYGASDDDGNQMIDVLYAPNTSTEDYAPVIDTVNYLSQGTNQSLSSATNNVTEYSRADIDDSSAPSYGSWTTKQQFSSISYPSELSRNGSYYHEVSADTTLPNNSDVNASLNNSSANHAASFVNDIYYALDGIASGSQSAVVSEAVNRVFYSQGGSSASSVPMGTVYYTRPYTYDPYTGHIISMGNWSANNSLALPASSARAGWISMNSSEPSLNISNLAPGENSNYDYQVNYLSSATSYTTKYSLSSATENINYIESGVGTKSTYSSTVNVKQPHVIEDDNGSNLFTGAWSAATPFSMPSSASYAGWTLNSSNGSIPTDTTGINPGTYTENVYYVPNEANIHIYYEDADNGSELSETSLAASASTPFNINDYLNSNYIKSISNYNYVGEMHSASSFDPNYGETHTIDLLYKPSMASGTDTENLNDIVDYYISGDNKPFSSAVSTNTYTRTDDIDPVNGSHSYGAWTTNTYFNNVSYSPDIISNGNYYHVSSADTSLPTTAQVDSELDKINGTPYHGLGAVPDGDQGFVNNIYYAPDSINNGTQSANVNETISYVLFSEGGSQVASSSSENVQYTRSYKYDTNTQSMVAMGNWTATNNFSAPSSYAKSGWTAVTSNVASPNVTNLSAGENSSYSYQVDYVSNAASYNVSSAGSSATEVINYIKRGSGGMSMLAGSYTSTVNLTRPYVIENNHVVFTGNWSMASQFSMPDSASYSGWTADSSNGVIPLDATGINPGTYTENVFYDQQIQQAKSSIHVHFINGNDVAIHPSDNFNNQLAGTSFTVPTPKIRGYKKPHIINPITEFSLTNGHTDDIYVQYRRIHLKPITVHYINSDDQSIGNDTFAYHSESISDIINQVTNKQISGYIHTGVIGMPSRFRAYPQNVYSMYKRIQQNSASNNSNGSSANTSTSNSGAPKANSGVPASGQSVASQTSSIVQNIIYQIDDNNNDFDTVTSNTTSPSASSSLNSENTSLVNSASSAIQSLVNSANNSANHRDINNNVNVSVVNSVVTSANSSANVALSSVISSAVSAIDANKVPQSTTSSTSKAANNPAINVNQNNSQSTSNNASASNVVSGNTNSNSTNNSTNISSENSQNNMISSSQAAQNDSNESVADSLSAEKSAFDESVATSMSASESASAAESRLMTSISTSASDSLRNFSVIASQSASIAISGAQASVNNSIAAQSNSDANAELSAVKFIGDELSSIASEDNSKANASATSIIAQSLVNDSVSISNSASAASVSLSIQNNPTNQINNTNTKENSASQGSSTFDSRSASVSAINAQNSAVASAITSVNQTLNTDSVVAGKKASSELNSAMSSASSAIDQQINNDRGAEASVINNVNVQLGTSASKAQSQAASSASTSASQAIQSVSVSASVSASSEVSLIESLNNSAQSVADSRINHGSTALPVSDHDANASASASVTVNVNSGNQVANNANSASGINESSAISIAVASTSVSAAASALSALQSASVSASNSALTALNNAEISASLSAEADKVAEKSPSDGSKGLASIDQSLNDDASAAEASANNSASASVSGNVNNTLSIASQSAARADESGSNQPINNNTSISFNPTNSAVNNNGNSGNSNDVSANASNSLASGANASVSTSPININISLGSVKNSLASAAKSLDQSFVNSIYNSGNRDNQSVSNSVNASRSETNSYLNSALNSASNVVNTDTNSLDSSIASAVTSAITSAQNHYQNNGSAISSADRQINSSASANKQAIANASASTSTYNNNVVNAGKASASASASQAIQSASNLVDQDESSAIKSFEDQTDNKVATLIKEYQSLASTTNNGAKSSGSNSGSDNQSGSTEFKDLETQVVDKLDRVIDDITTLIKGRGHPTPSGNGTKSNTANSGSDNQNNDDVMKTLKGQLNELARLTAKLTTLINNQNSKNSTSSNGSNSESSDHDLSDTIKALKNQWTELDQMIDGLAKSIKNDQNSGNNNESKAPNSGSTSGDDGTAFKSLSDELKPLINALNTIIKEYQNHPTPPNNKPSNSTSNGTESQTSNYSTNGSSSASSANPINIINVINSSSQSVDSISSSPSSVMSNESISSSSNSATPSARTTDATINSNNSRQKNSSMMFGSIGHHYSKPTHQSSKSEIRRENKSRNSDNRVNVKHTNHYGSEKRLSKSAHMVNTKDHYSESNSKHYTRKVTKNYHTDNGMNNDSRRSGQRNKLPQTGENQRQAALEALGTLSAMLGGLGAAGAHRKRRHDN